VTERTWDGFGLEVLGIKDFVDGRLDRPGTYVVCFGATWCAPTRRFMPTFVAEKGSLPGTLAIADISDRNDPLWDVFRIRITPSIVVFQDGVVRTRVDGRRMFGITSRALSELRDTLHSK
jgi:thiol-disulfide isomerase/thioredoxin